MKEIILQLAQIMTYEMLAKKIKQDCESCLAADEKNKDDAIESLCLSSSMILAKRSFEGMSTNEAIQQMKKGSEAIKNSLEN
jgi:hypothetical protein